jgi:hypothetical protein
MSNPLLVEGKIFAKRFELSLSKNGTFQKIAVQAKRVFVMPKFVNTAVSKIRLTKPSLPFNKDRKLAYNELMANKKLMKERRSENINLIALKKDSKISIESKIKTKNQLPKNPLKEWSEKNLRVKYNDCDHLINDKRITKTPDFDKHSIHEVKLSKKINEETDKIQFLEGMKDLLKNYKKDSKAFIKKLRASNSKILKRDNYIFNRNKDAIENAENKMMEAVKNKDLIEVEKWHKELRRLTNKLTFKRTPKGQPFKRYTDLDEIEKLQIKDIENPSSSAQGRFFGYIWHHDIDTDKIQLVAKDIHEFNLHTGGKAKSGGSRK